MDSGGRRKLQGQTVCPGFQSLCVEEIENAPLRKKDAGLGETLPGPARDPQPHPRQGRDSPHGDFFLPGGLGAGQLEARIFISGHFA